MRTSGPRSAPTSDAGSSHFITNGRAEGRVTTFDGLEYVASYADLANAFGANSDAGAAHYITAGAREGRDPDSFSAYHYLHNYADLEAASATMSRLLPRTTSPTAVSRAAPTLRSMRGPAGCGSWPLGDSITKGSGSPATGGLPRSTRPDH